MKPKTLYLILCVAGSLLHVISFLRQHGMAFRVYFEQFASTWSSGLLGTEVLVSSVALWVLIYVEGRRSRMKRLWVPVAAGLAMGVSVGLPLFLYLREARLQKSMWSGGRCEV